MENLPARQLVESILRRNRYLVLATAGSDGPWLAPLEYMIDDDLNFYVFSTDDSRHVRDLDARPEVAVAVFEHEQEEYGPTASFTLNGVQLEAIARRVPPAEYNADITAAIDAREGRVKVSGWEEDGGLEDAEAIRRAWRLGVTGVIYTSIARDGRLGGPDIERTNSIAAVTPLPVVLSGGVGGMRDLDRVAAERHERVVGAITGKAIYEGRFSPREAVLLLQGELPENQPC